MKLSDYRVYPLTLTDSEGDGVFTIRVEGIRGAITEATSDQVDEMALAAIIDIAEDHLQRRMVIAPAPAPKEGQRVLSIPAITALKIMLRSAMNERGITRSELARRMGTSSQSIVQSLTLSRKGTSLDTLFKAFEAIGMNVELTAE